MKKICRITNLGKSYKIKRSGHIENFDALADFSLSIDIGDVIGIIGLNGCGKSTLLKLISRTTSPTKGKILVKGDLLPMLEVGSGFQPDLTGRENIIINYSLISGGKQIDDSLIDTVANFAGTYDFIDEPLKHYSSGMQMKLAFSIAVHTNPSLIIIDEVLAVGDGKFQIKCFEKINQIRKHTSILLVSHNLTHIDELCSKVVYLEKGRIKFFGDTRVGIEMYKKDLSK